MLEIKFGETNNYYTLQEICKANYKQTFESKYNPKSLPTTTMQNTSTKQSYQVRTPNFDYYFSRPDHLLTHTEANNFCQAWGGQLQAKLWGTEKKEFTCEKMRPLPQIQAYRADENFLIKAELIQYQTPLLIYVIVGVIVAVAIALGSFLCYWKSAKATITRKYPQHKVVPPVTA